MWFCPGLSVDRREPSSALDRGGRMASVGPRPLLMMMMMIGIHETNHNSSGRTAKSVRPPQARGHMVERDARVCCTVNVANCVAV